MFSVLSVLQGCIFYSAFLLYNLDFILLLDDFNAICFMCFIFVIV